MMTEGWTVTRDQSKHPHSITITVVHWGHTVRRTSVGDLSETQVQWRVESMRNEIEKVLPHVS